MLQAAWRFTRCWVKRPVPLSPSRPHRSFRCASSFFARLQRAQPDGRSAVAPAWRSGGRCLARASCTAGAGTHCHSLTLRPARGAGIHRRPGGGQRCCRADVSAALLPGCRAGTGHAQSLRGARHAGGRRRHLPERRPRASSTCYRLARRFDYVVTVCDPEAAERCPVFPGEGRRLHWPFPDPSRTQGSDAEKLAQTCAVRDAIRRQIEEWAPTVR